MAAITFKDVAREANVSVASASRALNGGNGVTQETGQRIGDVASRLRYIPHAAARMLITRRTDTVGTLLADRYGEFFSELIRGIHWTRAAQSARVQLARRFGRGCSGSARDAGPRRS